MFLCVNVDKCVFVYLCEGIHMSILCVDMSNDYKMYLFVYGKCKCQVIYVLLVY